MKGSKFSLIAVCALALLTASCISTSPVPKKTMQKIYYDMLVADGYIESLPNAKMQTDTMAVYAPILENYGVSRDDFLQAQGLLLSDPEKFEKLITTVKERLESHQKELTRKVEVLDSISEAEFARVQDSLSCRENFLDSISFACLLDTVCISYSEDSTAVRILSHPKDSAATDSLTKADALDKSASEPKIAEDMEIVAEEVDFELKELEELEELEKASKLHKESLKKSDRKVKRKVRGQKEADKQI